MIKAIIFDIGGVLTKSGALWDYSEKYSKELGMTPEEIHAIIQKYWKLARTNIISSGEFWSKISKELGVNINEFKEKIIDIHIVYEHVIEFAKSFKGKYKLAILSNDVKDWSDAMINHYNLKEIFDVIIRSSEYEIAKPDHRIYQIAAKKLGVRPEECIFIDDWEENIIAANQVGMKGILFKDLDDLKKQLKEIL